MKEQIEKLIKEMRTKADEYATFESPHHEIHGFASLLEALIKPEVKWAVRVKKDDYTPFFLVDAPFGGGVLVWEAASDPGNPKLFDSVAKAKCFVELSSEAEWVRRKYSSYSVAEVILERKTTLSWRTISPSCIRFPKPKVKRMKCMGCGEYPATNTMFRVQSIITEYCLHRNDFTTDAVCGIVKEVEE